MVHRESCVFLPVPVSRHVADFEGLHQPADPADVGLADLCPRSLLG